MKQKSNAEYYNKATIKQHYHQQPVQNIMRIFSDFEGSHKAGKYDDKGLYQYSKDK